MQEQQHNNLLVSIWDYPQQFLLFPCKTSPLLSVSMCDHPQQYLSMSIHEVSMRGNIFRFYIQDHPQQFWSISLEPSPEIFRVSIWHQPQQSLESPCGTIPSYFQSILRGPSQQFQSIHNKPTPAIFRVLMLDNLQQVLKIVFKGTLWTLLGPDISLFYWILTDKPQAATITTTCIILGIDCPPELCVCSILLSNHSAIHPLISSNLLVMKQWQVAVSKDLEIWQTCLWTDG